MSDKLDKIELNKRVSFEAQSLFPKAEIEWEVNIITEVLCPECAGIGRLKIVCWSPSAVAEAANTTEEYNTCDQCNGSGLVMFRVEGFLETVLGTDREVECDNCGGKIKGGEHFFFQKACKLNDVPSFCGKCFKLAHSLQRGLEGRL